MQLESYCGKTVSIVDNEGHVFSGVVDDYFYPEDNDSGSESIVLKTNSGDLYEFTSEVIERITVA